MRKVNSEVPELTEEELAFEMIEVTCDEMDSLAKAFDMLSDLCAELNGEEPCEESLNNEIPSEAEIH